MTPASRRRTSADPVGLRASLPLKITSSILSPRRLFALCSPSTHVMASATLLLPHPLGPTMAVTPSSKASSERSENDLNPAICSRCKRMCRILVPTCRAGSCPRPPHARRKRGAALEPQHLVNRKSFSLFGIDLRRDRRPGERCPLYPGAAPVGPLRWRAVFPAPYLVARPFYYTIFGSVGRQDA